MMALRNAVKLWGHTGQRIKTAPAIEPVTAAQFRAHIVDDSLSDDEALGWISAARELVEANTGLALITQVWEITFDRWPNTGSEWWSGVRDGAISDILGDAAVVELPRYPLQDLDAAYSYAPDGTETAIIVATTFDVDTYSTPGRVSVMSGASLPSNLRRRNAIKLEYTAGYGDAAADVPAAIRLGIQQIAGYLYNHRGDGCDPGDALAAGMSLIGQYSTRRL